MPHQELSAFSRRLTILIGLGVVGAMSFGLAISFYRNLLFEETLSILAQRNRELRAGIDRGLEDLAYYRSHQYRDKYAKENLGRLNAGEKILILQELPSSTLPDLMEAPLLKQQRDIAYRQYLQRIPIIEHWWLYLFDPEGLEKLKKSF
jgi:hypothetical protein